LEQQDVMEFLHPWLDRIYTPFHVAMSRYNDEYPDSVRAEHTDSVAAHNIHCHLMHEFEREFSETPGFNFLESRGLKVLNIQDVLVARFKKVNEEGRHRNHPSKQQENFDRQLPLSGLPPAALRVTFGYEPDPAFSQCDRVMVARPQGKSIIWASQIIEEGDAIDWVDITPKRFAGTEPIVSGISFSKPA